MSNDPYQQRNYFDECDPLPSEETLKEIIMNHNNPIQIHTSPELQKKFQELTNLINNEKYGKINPKD